MTTPTVPRPREGGPTGRGLGACECGHVLAVHGPGRGMCHATDDEHGDRCCTCVAFRALTALEGS